MADNRMYLRCMGCGDAIVLAKMNTGMGWYSVMSAEQKGQELLDFIEKHHTCCNTIDDYDRYVEHDRDFERSTSYMRTIRTSRSASIIWRRTEKK